MAQASQWPKWKALRPSGSGTGRCVRVPGMASQIDQALLLLTEIRDSLVRRPPPVESALSPLAPVNRWGLRMTITRTRRKLARVVEAWADARGICLEGVGAWSDVSTDESYIVEPRPEGRTDVPDITLDVGERLHVYRGLGVPREVWLFDGARLTIWAFTSRAEPRDYVRVERSPILPDLDPSLIDQCMRAETQRDAVQALRQAHSKR